MIIVSNGAFLGVFISVPSALRYLPFPTRKSPNNPLVRLLSALMHTEQRKRKLHRLAVS